MARIAFYHRVKDGNREAYRKIHESVPKQLETEYLKAGDQIHQFSLFEKDGLVFGFIEVDNPEQLQSVMESSEIQKEWGETTLPLLEPLPDDIWMDEIYRLK